ncbi:MAG TPA: hypothetical protein VJ327_01695 [Patescibacteria group bacterium]|nr:hypothetical protein [Patescibacteria group bacterium]
MIKQRTILEVKIGERLYELHCGADSPLGELHDALMRMKGFTVDRMISAHREEQEQAEKQVNCDVC